MVPKFLAQIELEFYDGSKDRFLTAGRNENDESLEAFRWTYCRDKHI